MPKSKHQNPATPTQAASPAQTIAAGEFKAKCLELMDEVKERHVEYIVTKRGQPVAKLVPVDDAPKSFIGFMQGTVLWHGDIVSPDFEAWEESGSDPLNNP